MKDSELRAAFEDGSLDPDLFDHRNHLRLGWLYLQDCSPALAIDNFTRGLRRYTRSVGAQMKYNETITWFYMLAIAERRLKYPADSFEDFIARNSDLNTPGAPLLKRSYMPETLNSDLAREVFLLPDASSGTSARLAH